MRPQQITKHFVSVTMFLAILCGPGWTQQVAPCFYDDFSDGDPQDGLPVNWRHVQRGYAPNNCTWTEEGLELGDGLVGAANTAGSDYVYGDVSVTAQIRRMGSEPMGHTWIWNEGDYFAIAIRWQGNLADDCYWVSLTWPGYLKIGYSSGWTKKEWEVDLSPLDVNEQDLVLRLDAIGDRIQVWCWAAGEPMPDAPQLSFTDTRYGTGPVALLGATNPGSTSKWLVRWVEVTTPGVDPIVDFNGSGQVDIKDLVMLIESWGQNDPTVDIVRDGVVDVKDLEVLMDYWQQDVNDPTLMANWKFDETEGTVAYDSAAENDAAVIGDALWQPDEGLVDGALLCDGSGDYVTADFVLNPADGPFSVFAWIKGDLPGQVILSQAEGMNWLMIDAEQGTVKTELTQPIKDIRGTISEGASLTSSATITDGNWHRVGLVCDGAQRILYVDTIEVARDTIDTLASCKGALHIGAGSHLQPNSFWSGMIDDVRIYDRVIVP